MTSMRCVTSSPMPHVDGNLVLFEVSSEKGQQLCSISRLALEVVSGGRYFKPADLLAGFRKSRARIEDFAIRKWLARPDGVGGRLHLWADDMEDPLMGDVPDPVCAIAAQRPNA